MKLLKRTGYPKKYLLLDLAAIPFVFVATLKLAGDRDVIPSEWLFENYEWYLMGVGLTLLAPGVVFTILKGKSLGQNEN